MAEEQQIRNKVVVDVTQAVSAAKTLEQALRKVHQGMSALAKQDIPIPQELLDIEKSLSQRLDKMRGAYQKTQESVLNETIKTNHRIEQENEKAWQQYLAGEERKASQAAKIQERARQQQIKAEEQSYKQRAKEQENYWQAVARDNERLQQRLAQMNNSPTPFERVLPVHENVVNGRTDLAQKVHDITPVVPQYATYQKQLSALNRQAEQFYRTWKETGSEQAHIDFSRTVGQFVGVNRQVEEFNQRLGVSIKRGSLLDDFAIKFRSHFAWIATGAIMSAGFGAIGEGISSMIDLESRMAGVAQVMPTIEHNQKLTNKELKTFIGIAGNYGAAVDEVVEGARSFGRMYGSMPNAIQNVNMLTKQATKMAVADNFSVTQSVKGLESALSQYGMITYDTAQLQANTNRILDVWTKLAHNGAASAQDLTEGVMLAGATAHQTGVSFEFLNAMIATGVRATGRSGNEIGNALKSMFSSMQTGKSIKALQDFGVQVYKTTAEGKREFRDFQDIILETALKVSRTDQNTNQLMLTLAGGKFQVSKVSAIMHDYKELLRTYAMANDVIDSKGGFTDKQVGIQMETVSRRLQALKADFKDLAVAIGYGTDGTDGAVASMKAMIKTVDHIIVGIKNMNETWGGTLKTLILFGVIVKGVPVFMSRASFALAQFIESTKLAYASQTSLSGSLMNVYDKIITNTWAEGKAAAQIAHTAAETAKKKAAVDSESASLDRETAALDRATVAQERNASAKATSTGSNITSATSTVAPVIGNSAKAQATAEVEKLTVATKAHTVAEILDSNATARAKAQQVAMNGVVAAGTTITTAATGALGGLRAILAGLGGPIGLAITALSILLPMFLMQADYEGEVAKSQENLNEKTAEGISQSMEMAEQSARQSEVCTKLAEQYNQLNESLSTLQEGSDEYKNTQDEMKAISEEVSNILHVSSEQFIDDNGMNIDSIQALASADKQAAINKLETIKNDLEANKKATQQHINNTSKRIETLEHEADSVSALGRIYDWLYLKIAGVYESMAIMLQRRSNQLQQDKEMLASVRDAGLSGESSDEALFHYDEETLGLGATEGDIDTTANNLSDAAQQYRKIAQDMVEHANEGGGSASLADAKQALADAGNKVDSLTADIESIDSNIKNVNSLIDDITNGNITSHNDHNKGEVGETSAEKKAREKADNAARNRAASDARAQRAQEREQKKLENEDKKRYKAEVDAVKKDYDREKKNYESTLKQIALEEKLHGASMQTAKARYKAENDFRWVLNQLDQRVNQIRADAGTDTFDIDAEKGGSEIAQRIVAGANTYLNTPYVLGGESTNGIDCSGLVQAVFDGVGIGISRTADAQAQDFANKGALKDLSDGNLHAGDPVFMYWDGTDYGSVNGKPVGHVVISADGADDVIAASSTNGKVLHQSLQDLINSGAQIAGYGSVADYTGFKDTQSETVDMIGLHDKFRGEYVEHSLKQNADAYESVSKMAKTIQDVANFVANYKTHSIGVDITDTEKADIEYARDKQIADKVQQKLAQAVGELHLDKNSLPYKQLLDQLYSMETTAANSFRNTIQARWDDKNNQLKYREDMYNAKRPEYTSIAQSHEDAEHEKRMAKERVANAQARMDALDNQVLSPLDYKPAEDKIKEEEQKLADLKKKNGVTPDEINQQTMAVENARLALERMKQESVDVNSKAYREAEVELQQSLQNLQKVEHKYRDQLRQGAYELTQQLLIQGNSLRDIWRNLWNQLANDALKALFRINNGDNLGLLGRLFSGFGRAKTPAKATAHGGIVGGGSLPAAAYGTVTNGTTIAGEDGQEVVIPVEKHKENSMNLLQYAAKKLGTSTGVSPVVSPTIQRATQATLQANNVNREHLARLDSQINLMRQQNEMLLHMINNGNGGGQNTITQPIVMKQSISSAEFGALMSKAQRLNQAQ